MRTTRARTITSTLVAGLLLVPATAAVAAAGTDAGAQRAEGSFVASVDFPTLQARDVRGNKCEFTVEGTLTFSGDVVGEAVGTTTAVIFAPCDDALASPPGTSFDVFRFEGVFSGEVLGDPTSGALSYAGVTRVGGAIDATVILDGDDGARAVVRADAQVAVGGTYSGVARRS
ncbi:hypothetical protein [Ornithinimicrobium cerasi]|uniref:Uncharacterized protein n=1 Tax=Ornithinimicrobium cerasi TaxID=2248773 RepID=A0A285VIR7_9MICO|nr:hypothetical protein [Ornithinimicrobium cerasi]SOC53757.1 hypothetical protein SAMN05421879_102115 [Ornithinimicrobium cerasi]